ncbi:RAD51-associated protein 1 isoform X2 [Rhincodon typus]|uniref:RAD51-associated protein 1 isoform X2 n=1 Tax=Rhincodon typus TaxID=259920 RepID=UPI00202F7074|nr:RAD51-associated protein 1 isoform X2 [Rhincodon typus]
MARPVRNKKIVDYSQGGDFDDDEDFAYVSGPPSKKSRLTTKDQKQIKGKKNNISGSQDAKAEKERPKERLPLDEKLYQRNLKAALVLSVQEPASEGSSVRSRPKRAATQSKQILLDDRGIDGECEEDSAGEQDYMAEFTLESDIQAKYIGQSAELLTLILPEDVFVNAEESESSENSTDEDEEFTFKNMSNKNKKKDKIKTQTKKKEKKSLKLDNIPTAVVPVKSKPLLLEEMPASLPPSKSLQESCLSTGIKKPKWTPPAPKESSGNPREQTSVRSPCQGLRLGLSRLARVKPLHPISDND